MKDIHYGEMVRDILADTGYTKTYIIKKSGMSRANLYKVFDNKSPTVNSVVALLAPLGIDLNVLRGENFPSMQEDPGQSGMEDLRKSIEELQNEIKEMKKGS